MRSARKQEGPAKLLPAILPRRQTPLGTATDHSSCQSCTRSNKLAVASFVPSIGVQAGPDLRMLASLARQGFAGLEPIVLTLLEICPAAPSVEPVQQTPH